MRPSRHVVFRGRRTSAGAMPMVAFAERAAAGRTERPRAWAPPKAAGRHRSAGHLPAIEGGARRRRQPPSKRGHLPAKAGRHRSLAVRLAQPVAFAPRGLRAGGARRQAPCRWSPSPNAPQRGAQSALGHGRRRRLPAGIEARATFRPSKAAHVAGVNHHRSAATFRPRRAGIEALQCALAQPVAFAPRGLRAGGARRAGAMPMVAFAERAAAGRTERPRAWAPPKAAGRHRSAGHLPAIEGGARRRRQPPSKRGHLPAKAGRHRSLAVRLAQPVAFAPRGLRAGGARRQAPCRWSPSPNAPQRGAQSALGHGRRRRLPAGIEARATFRPSKAHVAG